MKLKALFGVLCMALVLSSCGGAPSEPTPSSSSETPSSSELPAPPEVEGDYISIHYQRTDNRYNAWALWLWESGKDGAEYEFNGYDDYGAVAKYPLSTWSEKITLNGLGFIVKTVGSWTKDVEIDRFIDFSKLNQGDDGGYHIYLLTGDENIYVNPEREFVDEINVCEFVSFNEIAISCTNPIDSFEILENDTVIHSELLNGQELVDYIYTFEEGTQASLSNGYTVNVKFTASQRTLTKSVSFKNLYATEEFSSAYDYTGNDLGASYSSESTTFKVWSPVSTSIKLRIYDNGTPTSVDATIGDDTYTEYDMTKEAGTFVATVNGDLAGKYYTYVVTNGTFKIAKSLTHTLRVLVLMVYVV